MKKKLYIELEETLEWMTKNIPKHKESEFIRQAVATAIKRLSTPRKKKVLRR